MPGGRPTKYSPKLAAALCADIAYCPEAEKGLKVHEACAKHGCSVSSFFLWLVEYQEFSEAYAHAREARFEQLAEETLVIPDAIPDTAYWELADGRKVPSLQGLEDDETKGAKLKFLSKEVVMKAQLQVLSRQWYLEKLAPHRFGKKVALEHAGKDGGPIKSESTVQFYMPDNQRDAPSE